MNKRELKIYQDAFKKAKEIGEILLKSNQPSHIIMDAYTLECNLQKEVERLTNILETGAE